MNAPQRLLASFGLRAAIQPLFTVEARPEETWARYADGSVAVAETDSSADADAGWEIFIGTPRLTPELLRAAAKLARVHVFTEAKVPVWVAEGYVAIQAHAPGPVIVDVGQAVPVFDALEKQRLGQGPRLQVPFKQGETRVLRY
jgi:hypothetical protein